MNIFCGSTNQNVHLKSQTEVKFQPWLSPLLKSWKSSPPSPPGCSMPRPPSKVDNSKLSNRSKTIKSKREQGIKQNKTKDKPPSVGRCNRMCTRGPADEEHRTDF